MITASVTNPSVTITCEVRRSGDDWEAKIGSFVGYGKSREGAIRALAAAVVTGAGGHEVLFPDMTGIVVDGSEASCAG